MSSSRITNVCQHGFKIKRYFLCACHGYFPCSGQDSVLDWQATAILGLVCSPHLRIRFLTNVSITLGCWFTSDKVRLLANFVPRWIIIISILGMYAQLCFVLRRAHSRFTSSQETSSNAVSALAITNNVIPSTRAAANGTEGTYYNEPRHLHVAEKSAKRLKKVCRAHRPQIDPTAHLTVFKGGSSYDHVPASVYAYLDTSDSCPDLPDIAGFAGSIPFTNYRQGK